MKNITRREFFKNAAIAAASGYMALKALPSLARMMGGGGGMGGGGTSVIDPPVGEVFRDPLILPNKSMTQGVVEVDLEAMIAPVNVNGVMANLMTYNGYSPGAAIVASKGDLLRINFKNSLPDTMETNILGHPKYVTNLHTHGLHVSPTGIADNVMRMFMPGESGLFEYDLSKQAPGTFNFYHPHVHGTVGEQLWHGMYGGLMITDEVTTLADYETHVMAIKDIELVGTAPAWHDSISDFMHGPEGDTVMVNGLVNPRLTIRPGQVQRWRIVNASNARFYRLSLQDHSMYLIGTDGGLLDRPYQLSEVLLSPGERVDLLIKATKNSGTYKFLSLPYNRGGMSKQQTITLMTLVYSGSRINQALPTSVNPEARRLNIDTSMLKKETITLSMGRGAAYINGIQFIDHEHCAMIHSEVNTYEIWEVINNSGMDHPFHQHTNSVQVLSITGGDSKYASLYTTIPAMKDVVIIPKWGKATLLVPIMDYASDMMGMPMIHCHIPEHEDIGMMAVWHIMDTM